jgi:hypothetical protein
MQCCSMHWVLTSRRMPSRAYCCSSPEPWCCSGSKVVLVAGEGMPQHRTVGLYWHRLR